MADAGIADAGAIDGGTPDGGISDAGRPDGGAPDSGGAFDAGMVLLVPERVDLSLASVLQLAWIRLDGGFLAAFSGWQGYGNVSKAWFDDALQLVWRSDISPPGQALSGRPSLLQFGSNVTFVSVGSFPPMTGAGYALGEQPLAQAMDPDGGAPSYAAWTSPDCVFEWGPDPVASGSAILAPCNGNPTTSIVTLLEGGGQLAPETVLPGFGAGFASVPGGFLVATALSDGGACTGIEVMRVGPDLSVSKEVVVDSADCLAVPSAWQMVLGGLGDGGASLAWSGALDGGWSAIWRVEGVFSGGMPRLAGWSDAGTPTLWLGPDSAGNAVAWVSSGAPGIGQVSWQSSSGVIVEVLPSPTYLPARAFPRVLGLPDGTRIMTIALDAGQGAGIYAVPFVPP